MNKELTKEQEKAVKESIISAMRDVYIETGVIPNEEEFKSSAGALADKIIKNTQVILKENESPKGLKEAISKLYVNEKQIGKISRKKFKQNKGFIIKGGNIIKKKKHVRK